MKWTHGDTPQRSCGGGDKEPRKEAKVSMVMEDLRGVECLLAGGVEVAAKGQRCGRRE